MDSVGVSVLAVVCRNRVSNPEPLYLESSALLLSYSCHEALQAVVVVGNMALYPWTDPTLADGEWLPASHPQFISPPVSWH